MQTLRGYDSLSPEDFFQGAPPAPFSPLNNLDAMIVPYVEPTFMAPRRQSDQTNDAFAALQQSMRRIAPHVPPDVLQWHYINRLAELSNPTPDTLNPVASHDSPPRSDETLAAFDAASQSTAKAQSQNPFAAAAMASRGSRAIQPISEGNAPNSIANLIGSVSPAPLSAPNIMEDPVVSAAKARHATSPAAHGHIQPIRTQNPLLSPEYLRGHIATPSLPTPNFATTNPNAAAKSERASSTIWDYVNAGRGYADAAGARWMPVAGPVLDLLDDYEEGDVLGGMIDAGLLVSDFAGGFLLKVPAKLAAKGLGKGLWKGVPKALEKSGVAEQWKQLKKTVTQNLGKELRGYWKFGSHEWDDTRSYLGRYYKSIGKALPKDMPVHHYLIPQRWQRNLPYLFPEWLTNQPWNLLPLTRVSETTAPRVLDFHNAIEGKGRKIWQFDEDNPLRNLLMRYEYGTPDWAKIGIPTYATMGVGNAVKAVSDK